MEKFELFTCSDKEFEDFFKGLHGKNWDELDDDSTLEQLILLCVRYYADDIALLVEVSKRKFYKSGRTDFLILYAYASYSYMTVIERDLYDMLKKYSSETSDQSSKAILDFLASKYFFLDQDIEAHKNQLNESLELDTENVGAYVDLYLLNKDFNHILAKGILFIAIRKIERVFDVSDLSGYKDFFTFESFCKRNITMKHVDVQTVNRMQSWIDE